MKKIAGIGALAVVAGWFLAASEVEAGDRGRVGLGLHFGGSGFHVGVRVGGHPRFHSRRHHRGVRHRRAHLRHARHGRPHRVRVPVYEKVWVPPVYRHRIVAYDSCHRPIYRRICVRRGYYERVFKCYRYVVRY